MAMFFRKKNAEKPMLTAVFKISHFSEDPGLE